MKTVQYKVSAVQKFIRRELPVLLQKDLAELQMVKEADLECCAYYHLRIFLKKHNAWRIFARKYAPTGHFIDLLLFKNNTPRISVELKWNRENIGKKDKKSLKSSLSTMSVNRAYFISTVTKGEDSERTSFYTKKIQRYNIKGIFIPLGKELIEKQEWIEHRRRYMGDMQKGKARHKSILPMGERKQSR